MELGVMVVLDSSLETIVSNSRSFESGEDNLHCSRQILSLLVQN